MLSFQKRLKVTGTRARAKRDPITRYISLVMIVKLLCSSLSFVNLPFNLYEFSRELFDQDIQPTLVLSNQCYGIIKYDRITLQDSKFRLTFCTKKNVCHNARKDNIIYQIFRNVHLKECKMTIVLLLRAIR